MPPLSLFLTSLPWTGTEITLNVLAGLGAILIIYGIFLEAERWQDAVFVVGAGLLLMYALWIGNTIFSIAMGGIMLGSLIELVEIIIARRSAARTLNPKI